MDTQDLASAGPLSILQAQKGQEGWLLTKGHCQVVWDLQGEQGPCPCGCPGCDSTLISRTFCPPILLLLLPTVLPSPAQGAHGWAAEAEGSL